MKIEHFALNVKDPHAMGDWWVENLGMHYLRRDAEGTKICFLGDDDNETIMEIYSNPAGEYPDYAELSIFTLHIAFAVEDISAEQSRLIAAGAIPHGDGSIMALPGNTKAAFVRDPHSGVVIQLLQREKPLVS